MPVRGGTTARSCPLPSAREGEAFWGDLAGTGDNKGARGAFSQSPCPPWLFCVIATPFEEIMERTRLLGALVALLALFSCATLLSSLICYRLYQGVQAELDQERSLPPPSEGKRLVEEAPVSPLVGQRMEASEEIQGLTEYVEKLERENRNLRQQLAQQSQRRAEEGASSGGRRRRDFRGGSFSMEELKERDPEAYERFQQMSQEREQRRQEQRERREDYLSSVDTRRLTAQQQETLKEYQELLASLEEEGLPRGAGRGEQFREMMEMRNEVQEILLEDLGNRLGTDSASLAEGVQEIMSVLGGPGGGPGMMPPQFMR